MRKKQIWIVSERFLGGGKYHPLRYYYSKTEAVKDVADGGMDGALPHRQIERVEILEKYQLYMPLTCSCSRNLSEKQL